MLHLMGLVYLRLQQTIVGRFLNPELKIQLVKSENTLIERDGVGGCCFVWLLCSATQVPSLKLQQSPTMYP